MNILTIAAVTVYFTILDPTCYVFGQPPPETDCPNAPKNLTKLVQEIYYDGTTNADHNALAQVCASYHKFKSALSVTFKIGSYVGYDIEGRLVCYFYANQDCTVMFQHACASVMASDFKKFVCCHTGEKRSLDECLAEQNIDKTAFETCVAGNDPKINPEDILLKNSGSMYKKAPEIRSFPGFLVDGAYDPCTSEQLYYYWLKTTCKMYADPKPEPCL